MSRLAQRVSVGDVAAWVAAARRGRRDVRTPRADRVPGAVLGLSVARAARHFVLPTLGLVWHLRDLPARRGRHYLVCTRIDSRRVSAGRYIPEHPLDRLLRQQDPLSPASDRLEVIWSYYEQEERCSISRPPTAKERERVMLWLRAPRVDGDGASLLLRRPMLRGSAFFTLVEKAGTIRQFSCPACEILTEADGHFPVNINFHVDVEPWAAQSTRDKVKIREAVTRKMRQDGHVEPSDHNFCVSIVSLVRKSARTMDVDNIVKGLLDSLQGVLYHNDKQVQCLTSRRMPYNGPAGAYFLSAVAVRPWDADVIFDDGKPPTFL